MKQSKLQAIAKVLANGTKKQEKLGRFTYQRIKVVVSPRDHDGSFEPKIIGKWQTCLTPFDDQILAIYTKGISRRDIAATLKQMHRANVSLAWISKVTDVVNEQVVE